MCPSANAFDVVHCAHAYGGKIIFKNVRIRHQLLIIFSVLLAFIAGKLYVSVSSPAPLILAPVRGAEATKVSSYSRTTLTIGKTVLHVDIADTPALRAHGLSNRTQLSDNMGMLFIFDAPGRYGFWMSNMRFPIDLIWIDAEHRIVGVTSDVSPNSFPEIFYPPGPVRYVLETPAGFFESHNLSVGEMAGWNF